MLVRSSHIREADWHDGALFLTFRNGSTYRYDGVPEEKWKRFQVAFSKGEFFHNEIKPHHEATKL